MAVKKYCALSGQADAERMGTMPTISVLMAVYRPNPDWLKQQLQSLADQTWREVELLVRDDCPQEPVGEQAFSLLINRMPVSYKVNEKNLGPGATFARLVEEAKGEYIAFCDQDDIWIPEKLEILLKELQSRQGAACYCDLSVIDANGRQTATDVRQVRTGDIFLEGTGLAEKLFIKNCIYGCSMLMPTVLAKQALPLPDGMGHDHWFSLWAASKGEIIHVKQPLVRYRLHGDNQSNTLQRIHTKKDYMEQRIMGLHHQAEQCRARFPQDSFLQKYIERVENWTNTRLRWFQGDLRAFWPLWKERRLSPKAALFELVAARMPQRMFSAILKKIR